MKRSAFIAGVLLFVFWLLYVTETAPFSVKLATPTGYYAFFLNNNLIVYGKSSNVGSKMVRITDVYYVRTNIDPSTKEVSSNVIKRGQEWHAPDQMLVNADNIILVEPVGKGSKIDELLRSGK